MCLRGVFWRWMAMNRAQVAAIERGLCGSLPQRCAAAASDGGLCRHQTPRADHVVGESVPQRDGLDLVHAAHKKWQYSNCMNAPYSESAANLPRWRIIEKR